MGRRVSDAAFRMAVNENYGNEQSNDAMTMAKAAEQLRVIEQEQNDYRRFTIDIINYYFILI